MTSIRKHKWIRFVSAMLSFMFMATLFPLTVSSAQVAEKSAKALVFPVTDNSGSEVTGIGRMASGALQLAIDAGPTLEATDFNSTSAIVRRALSEGRLLPAQIENPSADALEAIKIGRALMMDKVILAQVEAIQPTGDGSQTVEVVLSGSMYDVAANYDQQALQASSSNVERAFGVVGVSKPRANYTGSQRSMVREAIEDAAYKVSQILSGKTAVDIAAGRAVSTHKKSGMGKLGYILGLGLLIALVAGSSGGGGGGSPATAAAPVPSPVEVDPNAIRLYWQAPTGTTLTLLGYQIERSDNGQPFQRIADPSQATASSTSWPDFNVIAGHSYQYRIRAVYTNSTFSVFKLFTAVQFSG